MKFQQCCEAKVLTTNNIDAITNSTWRNFQRGFLFYIEVIIIFFFVFKIENKRIFKVELICKQFSAGWVVHCIHLFPSLIILPI